MRNFSKLAAALLAAFASVPASAVQFDGFLTAGGALSDEATTGYLGTINDEISFETDSRFGLQISSDIADDTSVVAQLLGAGADENFNAKVEWAYIDYEFNGNVSLRAGKIKEPVFLISDYVEVGYAYPWIRPPAEVYSNNPLNTVNGMELLIQFPMGKNVLSLQPYLGSNTEDIPGTNGFGQFEATAISGIDIKFAGRGYTIHASTLKTDVTTQGGLQIPLNAPGSSGTLAANLVSAGEAELTSAGFNLDIANVVLYAEWQEREITGTVSTLFPDQESSYVTLGYRIGKWLPHVTVATIEGTTSTAPSSAGTTAVTCADASGCTVGGNPFADGAPLGNFGRAEQDSTTVGLRYELNDSAALKFEYQIIDVATGSMMDPNFGLFEASFTSPAPADEIAITSIALDVIF